MNRVIHFEIQANDVDRAKNFYKNVFGWEITHEMKKEEGGMDYWLIKTGDSGEGINGGMYSRPRKTEKKYYLFDCTIDVLDIDKAILDVKANNGKITMEKTEIPNVGWFVSAKDTEGNRFGLMQSTMQPKK